MVDDFMVHRPKAKRKPIKSFSEMKGSKHPIAQSIGGEQLGHDQQLPVNPQTDGKSSPLINPGEAGHPMNPGRIGEAMGDEPRGPEFY